MVRIPVNTRKNKSRVEDTVSAEAGPNPPRPHRRPAGTGNEDAAPDQGSTSTPAPVDVPDPTVIREDEGLEPEPSEGPAAADPTVPPASQPIDVRAPDVDVLGAVASEMEGPAGADVTGGDVTDPQDAERAVEQNVATRVAEQEVFGQQGAGELETQTKDLKPSPGQPDGGLPPNPTGSESASGGAEESATEGTSNASAAPAPTSAATVNGAQAQAAPAQGLDEKDEQLLRVIADFENYKRQAARREAEARERAIKGVLEDLLPVLDNFERALEAARNARDVESVRVGVEFIAQQLRDTLKNHGVEPIQAHGHKFDPLHHEALEQVSDSGHPEGTVLEEAQRGYSFKGQVLRPSRVRVAGKQANRK